MSDVYYVKDGSEFQLRKRSNLPSFPDQTLWFGNRVAILFDIETGTLLKHGDPDRVEAYVKKSRAAAQEGGFPSLTLGWTCLVSDRFSVDDLNKCLTHSSYVGVFYKRLLALEGLK